MKKIIKNKNLGKVRNVKTAKGEIKILPKLNLRRRVFLIKAGRPIKGKRTFRKNRNLEKK